MGNPKYIGQCKMVRFKTIYIESVDTGASIPLMTDGIINVSLIFQSAAWGAQYSQINLIITIEYL